MPFERGARQTPFAIDERTEGCGQPPYPDCHHDWQHGNGWAPWTGVQAFIESLATMKAIWKDTVIAESDATVELEGNQYFPSSGVNMDHLKASDHHTTCPWKGEASYYHVVVDGEKNENAAWYYPEPSEAASQIEGYIAFWNGVEVSE